MTTATEILAPQTLKITATFTTAAEAVAAAGLDTSYNHREAKRELARHQPGTYYVADERVFYVYQCDVQLLNEIDEMSLGGGSVLHNSPFSVATISENEITIKRANLPRTMQIRKLAARMGLILTTV